MISGIHESTAQRKAHYLGGVQSVRAVIPLEVESVIQEPDRANVTRARWTRAPLAKTEASL